MRGGFPPPDLGADLGEDAFPHPEPGGAAPGGIYSDNSIRRYPFYC